MTREEANKAMREFLPVVHHDRVNCTNIAYKGINALIKRRILNKHTGKYKFIYSAELQSNVANSVTIAAIEEIELYK